MIGEIRVCAEDGSYSIYIRNVLSTKVGGG